MMIAMGIFSLCALALCSLYLFSLKGFNAVSNYSVLDKNNRAAMDLLTSEVRESLRVSSFTKNPPSLTIEYTTNYFITYSFDTTKNWMTRSTSAGASQVLLTNCSVLDFKLFTRCPSNFQWGVFPVGTNDWQGSIKLVQLTWKSSITNHPNETVNSENVQTAQIVIRKQRQN
jgi:hypothetical protein